jgi:hypothetical protein
VALDIFRRKQKTIFWIVAIVVIPSFIFLYGSSSAGRGGGTGAVLMEVNGRSVRVSQVQDLWRRFQAVTGQPTVVQAPVRDERVQDLWSAGLTLAYIDAAREAGLTVSDKEVGTFIRRMPSFEGADGRFDPGRYRKVIQSRSVSNREYQRAVRELLLIERFRGLLRAGVQPTEETDYLAYAWENTRCTYGKATVPIDRYMADEPEVLDLPEEEAQAAIRLFYETHRDNPRFREPARWRFEYVLAPFDEFSVEVTERELTRYHQEHTEEYDGQPLDEVREEVTADYVAARRRELARSTITDLLEREIREAVQEEGPVLAEDLVADEALRRRGVRTGTSGPAPLAPTEFHRVEAIGDSLELQQHFQALTEELEHLREASGEEGEEYATRLEALKVGFDNRSDPLQSETGVFRVRVLEYQPPRVKELDEPGVKVAVLDEMRREEAFDRARESAETLATTIEAEGADAVELETIEATFPALPEDLQAASLGDPRILEVPAGYEVLVLTGRTPPTREAWEAQQPVMKQIRRQFIARELADVRLHAWKVGAIQSGRVRLLLPEREAE